MLKEKLRELRKSKGWTQDDLAIKSGFSRSSIINWETGRREPKIGDIERLAQALGTSVECLMDFGDGSNNDHDVLGQILHNLVSSPQVMKKTNPQSISYWGGVVDNARSVALRHDENEIKEVSGMLRWALSLIETIEKPETLDTDVDKSSLLYAIPNISAYNGSNSSYNGNVMKVESKRNPVEKRT